MGQDHCLTWVGEPTYNPKEPGGSGLPQVMCPQCGAKNDTRAADYPFCVGCQDNLAKCGYCRWFDLDTGTCSHPVVAGIFEVSESATPPCVYHAPNERVVVSRRLGQLLIWVAMAAVVALIGFGVARLRGPPGPPPIPKLELAIEADYEGAVVGEPFTVTALIYNTSDLWAASVRFEIAGRSLDQFELVSVTPRPTAAARRGRWEMLSYPPLDPGGRQRIDLHLIPKKAGTLHLTVRLVSGDNLYHGMADLPVIVEPPPGEAEGEGTLGDEERRL